MGTGVGAPGEEVGALEGGVEGAAVRGDGQAREVPRELRRGDRHPREPWGGGRNPMRDRNPNGK